MKLIWRIVGAGGCHSGRALLAQIRSPGFNFQQLLAFDFPPFVSTSYHRSWLYFQWRQLRCSSICTSSLASWCVSLLQGSTQQSAVMSVNQSEDGTPTNTQAIATVTAAAAVAASSQFRRLKVSLEDVTVHYCTGVIGETLQAFFCHKSDENLHQEVHVQVMYYVRHLYVM